MGAEDTTGIFNMGKYPWVLWKELGEELEEKVGATWIWRDLLPPRQSVGLVGAWPARRAVRTRGRGF